MLLMSMPFGSVTNVTILTCYIVCMYCIVLAYCSDCRRLAMLILQGSTILEGNFLSTQPFHCDCLQCIHTWVGLIEAMSIPNNL